MQLVWLTKIVGATDFGQTLSKDVQVSPTALQEEVLQLRAAMLLMIRNEAFQPQMRLCSKTVLNATKTAIASSQGPLVRAHQAT